MNGNPLEIKSIVEPHFMNRAGRRAEATVVRKSKNVRGTNFTKPKKKRK